MLAEPRPRARQFGLSLSENGDNVKALRLPAAKGMIGALVNINRYQPGFHHANDKFFPRRSRGRNL
jgi:hypothetical protein